MNTNIERLTLLFLGVFAALVVAVIVWQVGWIIPQHKCEKAHRWWDNGERICAYPVMVTDFTRRPILDKAGEAAARDAIGRPAPKLDPAKH